MSRDAGGAVAPAPCPPRIIAQRHLRGKRIGRPSSPLRCARRARSTGQGYAPADGREKMPRRIPRQAREPRSYETLAEVLGWAGKPEDSLRFIRRAMRLNPHYLFFYLWTLGHASYMLRRNGDAVDAFKKVTQQNPNFLPAHPYLAVVFAEMGREKEAREAWAKARQLSPGASLLTLSQHLPYRRPAGLDRLLTAANKGGIH